MNIAHLTLSGTQSHAGINETLRASGNVHSQSYKLGEDVRLAVGECDFILIEHAGQGSTPAAASSDSASQDAPFMDLLNSLSRAHRTSFLCVCTLDARGIEDARFRWSCFEARAQMVTVAHAAADLRTVLQRVEKLRQQRLEVASAGSSSKSKVRLYSCPVCAQSGLSEDTLHAHQPLYHANFVQRKPIECPICHKSQKVFGPHLQNDHGPPSRGEAPSEHVVLNVINPVVLSVVRRPSDGKFLMVQEFAASGFWLPGGRAENGETLQDAAKREAKEEAGVDIELTGVLTIEYHSAAEPAAGSHHKAGMTKLLVVFLARPLEPLFSAAASSNASSAASASSASPSSPSSSLVKTVPDFESCGAVWVHASELQHLKVRFGSPSRTWFEYVEAGGEVHSLNILKSFLRKDAGRVPIKKHAETAANAASTSSATAAPAPPHSAL